MKIAIFVFAVLLVGCSKIPLEDAEFVPYPEKIGNYKLNISLPEDECKTLENVYMTYKTPQFNGQEVCFTGYQLKYLNDDGSAVLVFLQKYTKGGEILEANLKEYVAPTVNNGVQIFKLEKEELLWYTGAGNMSLVVVMEVEKKGGFVPVSENNEVTAWFLSHYPLDAQKMTSEKGVDVITSDSAKKDLNSVKAIFPENVDNFRLSQKIENEKMCNTMKELYTTERTLQYGDSRICYKQTLLNYIDSNNTVVAVNLFFVEEGREAFEATLLEQAESYSDSGKEILLLDKNVLVWFTNTAHATTILIMEGEQEPERLLEPAEKNPVREWFMENYPPEESRMQMEKI